jgi:hypothetical protein
MVSLIVHPLPFLPGTTFDAATKAEGLILTRRLAMELGRHGNHGECLGARLDCD